MVLAQILADLVVALGSSLDPGYEKPGGGPSFPFTYIRGHPSFPTPRLQIDGPFRLVVGNDHLKYTGEGRRRIIFQLPNELLLSIAGGGSDRLTIRVGDGDDFVDIDFQATGLTKKRDMRRLIEAVRKRSGNDLHQLPA